MVWYLGGELAETGVGLSSEDQIQRAEKALSLALPWVEIKNPQWQSFHIERAEPHQTRGARPDNAYCAKFDNMLLTWPTKLTLCPNLGDLVLSQLPPPVKCGFAPQALQQFLPAAELGALPWESPCLD